MLSSIATPQEEIFLTSATNVAPPGSHNASTYANVGWHCEPQIASPLLPESMARYLLTLFVE
ncbi:MAG: hypothetical protein NVV73_13925 [Cellvibrionaceae bacterium]|nr:hypothetical protein [Cellvibrionaceae bacterium]